MQHTEEMVQAAVQWLRLGVETTGAIIVGVGVVLALAGLLRSAFTGKFSSFNAIRLILAKHLALALEFQLGADILSTAIAPDWDQIGKLAAIAVIRTALNYFLSREMEAEQAQEEQARPPRERQPERAPASG